MRILHFDGIDVNNPTCLLHQETQTVDRVDIMQVLLIDHSKCLSVPISDLVAAFEGTVVGWGGESTF
jgi:hypothetical protein